MFKILLPLLLAFGLAPGAPAASLSQPLLLTSTYPSANTYYIAYYDFLSNTALTVPNNAYLEYDVFVTADSADFSGGVDLTGAGWANLRDYTSSSGSYIRDRNYLRAHPFSDLSPYAKGQWYHRKFDMGSAAGKGISEACLTNDTGNLSNGAPANNAGGYNAYFDNIKFTNAYGATLLDLFSNANALSLVGSPVVSSTAFGGASAATATNNSVAVTQAFTLAASPSSTLADGVSALTLTATMLGPGGTAVPGARVVLTSNRQGDVLNPSSGVTDAAGKLTATVVSSLAGNGAVSALAGPFSASTSFQFLAGAPTAWKLKVPNQTFVVGAGSTPLTVSAQDAQGNATVTARSVVVRSTDTQISLSTDNATFVAANLGITLTPSSGPTLFYTKITGGAYRYSTLTASDAVVAGALTTGTEGVIINNSAAASIALTLPLSGTAGSAMVLSATALDSLSRPAGSNLTLNFSSNSSGGAFSLDNGFSWAATTSTAMASGALSLLYRDTKAGSSQVSATSTLNNPTVSTTIVAGPAYALSGSANPTAVFNLASDGVNTSTLSALLVDAYGNPVSNTAVAFAVVAGGGSVASGSATTNAAGLATVVFTAGSTASNANYIRSSVPGLKASMINVTAAKPTRLNLSPDPATTGVDVATPFIVLAQDASNPAITGSSSATVSISSTTGTVQFSADGSTGWGSTLSLALSSGFGRFYARDSAPTGAAGVTITATDMSTSMAVGKVNLYIFQASLQVYQVSSSVLNVSRGETGLSVTMTVRNQGGTNVNLDLSAANTYLTFNGLTTNFTATGSGTNPTVVPAGGTAQLQFTVSVGASAPLGAIVLNGHVAGTDASTSAALNDGGSTAITGNWIDAGAATKLLVYENPGTPVAGAPIHVSIVALDASNNTVGGYALPLTLSTRLVASPGVTATGMVNVTYPAFVNGVAMLDSYYTLAQGVFLRADAGGLIGLSVGITPTAGPLNEYRIYNPTSAILGQFFSVTVSAMDIYGNTRAAASAVTFTPQGGTGALAVAWKDLSSGLVSFFNEAYSRAESIQLFANDGSVSSVLAETTPIAVYSVTSTITPTATPTATPSASPTASPSATPSGTPSISPTVTPTPTPTASPSGTPSATSSNTPTTSPTATPTATPSATPTATATATRTATPSVTPSASPTATPTATSSATPSASPTATSTATPSATATATPTATLTATPSATPSASPTATSTATPSATPTATPTATRTATPSATPSASPTATPTVTPSATPSASPTATATATPSATPSASPTATPTATPSATPSASPTATPTATPSATSSASPTATPTATPSATPSASPTATPTATPSATPTATPSSSPTATPSATASASPTATPTGTPSATPSVTPTATPTGTPSASPSATPTASPSASPTATPSASPTATASASPTATPTDSPTATASASPTATPTDSPTATVSASPTATPTDSPTATASASPTATPTDSPTATASASPTATPTDSPTATASASPTATPTDSPTATASASPSVTGTGTPTATASATATTSPTATPSDTVTPTATATPSSTPTPPWTATVTPTVSPTPTASPTSTASPSYASSGLTRNIISPNPVRSDQTMGVYFHKAPLRCVTMIYNLNGELIKAIITGRYEQPRWNVDGVASGLYLVTLLSDYDDGTRESNILKAAVIH